MKHGFRKRLSPPPPNPPTEQIRAIMLDGRMIVSAAAPDKMRSRAGIPSPMRPIASREDANGNAVPTFPRLDGVPVFVSPYLPVDLQQPVPMKNPTKVRWKKTGLRNRAGKSALYRDAMEFRKIRDSILAEAFRPRVALFA